MQDICIMKKLVSQFVDTYMENQSPRSCSGRRPRSRTFPRPSFRGLPARAGAQPTLTGFPQRTRSGTPSLSAHRPPPRRNRHLCISPKLLVDGTLEAAACLFVDIYKSKTQAEPEPLDGDETERLSKLFLQLIDDYQGNT